MATWTPSGEMRNRVFIQPPVATEDSMGTPKKPTWTAGRRAWAKFEGLTGNQTLIAQQAQQAITSLVKIRYMTGVTPLDRVKLGARVFSIVSVINVEEKNRELWLTVREVVVGQGG